MANYTQVDFTIVWDLLVSGGGDIFTHITPASLDSYGPAIIPGAPNAPTSYLIDGIGMLGVGPPPAVPSPYDAPYFLGFLIEPISSPDVPLGVAWCSGPAPGINPINPFTYSLDPTADLTVIRSWQLTGQKDTVSEWLPIASGVYYYLVVEAYGATLGRIASSIETDILSGAGGTEYQGVGETVVPVGATVALQAVISRGAGPVDFLIDWGDGTTESHTYNHPGFGGHGDDWLVNNQLTDFGSPFPSHVYSAVGSYLIAATFTDAAGGLSAFKTRVYAVGPPTCSLTVTPTTVELPGTVDIVATGHSDAWDMRADLAAVYGYDTTRRGISCFFAPPHTGWQLDQDTTVDAFASDHVTDPFWEGSGVPVDDPDPSSPAPNAVWFPATDRNIAFRNRQVPGSIRLVIQDCFDTWSQQALVDVDVSLGHVYERNVPRDDGRGISTARSFPPQVDSLRSVPRIP